MPRRGRQPARWLRESHAVGSIGYWSRRYLEWLRVRHYAEDTIKNRTVYLGMFLRWCEARALGRPEEVTKPILERYQRHLFYYRKNDGRPLSFRSQHGRLVTVRAFFKWLAKENVLLSNPASEIELPRLERRLPRAVLTISEAERVLAVPDVNDPLGLRDRTILEVLYGTGMRRKELVGLRLYDLDPERGTMLIRLGKGNKDRMVPVGERAMRWIETYLRDARPKLVMPPDDAVLFVSHMGDAMLPNRLTELVRDHVNASGVKKKGSCHLFRHTMATLMLEGGAEIRFIQEMLGHADVSTTQLYTQVSIQKLKEIHAATHPGAMLAKRKHDAGDDEREGAMDAAELLAVLDDEAGEEESEATPRP